MTRIGQLLAVALIGLSAIASCHGKPRPNVVVIAVNGLRPDRLGVYGNTRGLTPFIDQLAQRGAVFVNAFSTSSATVSAVASLMTSRDPRQHLVSARNSQLGAKEQTFAEVLQLDRYRTAGFSANDQLQQRLGYGQGFDHWQVEASAGGFPAKLRVQGLQWLAQNPTSQAQLIFFHFMGPGQPYTPPEPFRSRFLERPVTDEEIRATFVRVVTERNPETLAAGRQLVGQLYDGEVAALDDQLRQLFDELTAKGLLEHAVIVLTADHGEELLEHGETGNDRTLFNESIRIPLLVVAPGFRGGRRVDDNVSLLDVAPTLLDLVGIQAEPHFEGQSLVRFLDPDGTVAREWSQVIKREQPGVPRDLFFRLEFNGFGADQRTHRDGIVRWTQKLLVRRDGTRELYDLAKDPNEVTPNPPGSEGVADLLGRALDDETVALQRRAMVR